MIRTSEKVKPQKITGDLSTHIRNRTSKTLGTKRLPDIRNWLCCKSTLVNLAVSDGWGLAGGKVTEISAREGRGKTALALDFCRQALSINGIVVYIDLEAGLSKKLSTLMGIDWENPSWIYTCPELAEDVLDFIEEISVTHAESEEGSYRPLVIVVDSVPSLCIRAVAEISAKASRQQASQASLLSRFFAKPWPQRLQGSNVFIIMVNQLRSALRRTRDGEEELITPGGKAIPFYAHAQLQLDRQEIIFDPTKPKGIKIAMGIEVACTITKSKMTTPHDTVTYPLYTRPGLAPVVGIDNVASCLEYLRERNAIDRAGSWYTFGKIRVQGIESLYWELLRNEDPGYRRLLEEATRAVYLEERGEAEEEVVMEEPVNS